MTQRGHFSRVSCELSVDYSLSISPLHRRLDRLRRNSIFLARNYSLDNIFDYYLCTEFQYILTSDFKSHTVYPSNKSFGWLVTISGLIARAILFSVVPSANGVVLRYCSIIDNQVYSPQRGIFRNSLRLQLL